MDERTETLNSQILSKQNRLKNKMKSIVFVSYFNQISYLSYLTSFRCISNVETTEMERTFIKKFPKLRLRSNRKVEAENLVANSLLLSNLFDVSEIQKFALNLPY